MCRRRIREAGNNSIALRRPQHDCIRRAMPAAHRTTAGSGIHRGRLAHAGGHCALVASVVCLSLRLCGRLANAHLELRNFSTTPLNHHGGDHRCALALDIGPAARGNSLSSARGICFGFCSEPATCAERRRDPASSSAVCVAISQWRRKGGGGGHSPLPQTQCRSSAYTVLRPPCGGGLAGADGLCALGANDVPRRLIRAAPLCRSPPGGSELHHSSSMPIMRPTTVRAALRTRPGGARPPPGKRPRYPCWML